MVTLGKKILVYGLCSMLASPFMVMPRQTAYAAAPTAKTLYYGGTIYTMTESLEEVQQNVAPHQAYAVLVNDKTGKIEKVVTNPRDVNSYVEDASINRKFDLGNYVMLPGFIDPHGHFPSVPDYTSINLAPTPIGDIDTIEQLQNRLLEKINNRHYVEKGVNYIEATNYDDTLLDIESHPLHEQLSVGDLKDYCIVATHISGHLATINTKALRRFFETDYINSDGFKNAVKLPGKTINSAKLVNEGGSIYYQVAFTPADDEGKTTRNLPGILMRADAAATLAAGGPTPSVETYLQCMTGTFNEAAVGYIVKMPDAPYYDKFYDFDRDEIISLASKEYASRGVTTGLMGGSTLPRYEARGFFLGLSFYQRGLLQNKMKIRAILMPSAVNDIDAGSLMMTHTALAWEGADTTAVNEADRTLGHPSAISPKISDDISSWYPSTMENLGAILMGYPGIPASLGKDAPADSEAHQIYLKQQAGELPKDRIFLGAWKVIYDGSNQGYTGFFGQKGYYQLPDSDTPTFFPVGRTGTDDGTLGSVTVNADGMISIDDPKNFIEAGRHYGNPGTIGIAGPDAFERTAHTFERYHALGQTIHCHLNGSRASSDGVTFIERAVAAHPEIKDTRHTIIHAQMQELAETQRLMGNYDQYPLNNPQRLQDICTVWQGTAAMKWVPDSPQTVHTPGYDPEEGHYAAEFSDEAKQLRADLNNGQLMRDQNLISSYFVDHTYYWGQRHRDIFMGPGSAYNMSPMGWAVQLGHRWTMHNDTPVTPQNPLKSISIATTRLSSGYTAGGVKGPQEPIYHVGAGKDITATKKFYPTKIDADNNGEQRDYVYFDQRITVLQAIHALTVNSAWEHKGLEKKLGQIKEGYYADFVILAQDPFVLETQGEAGLLQIADIPVVATIVGGETVFGFVPGTEAGNFVANLESSFHNAAGVAISNITELDQTDEEMEAMLNGNEAGQKLFGAKKFTADVDPAGSIAAFSVQVMGNGLPISSLNVKSLATAAGEALPYQFAEQVMNDDQGMFWVTDRTLEAVLSGDTIMEPGKAYYIHFTVEDGGDYDLDAAEDGAVTGQIFVTSSELPVAPAASNVSTGSGGSGGCTVGAGAQYELVFVLFAALGLLAVRVYRNREDA